jgi:hypothetical protein
MAESTGANFCESFRDLLELLWAVSREVIPDKMAEGAAVLVKRACSCGLSERRNLCFASSNGLYIERMGQGWSLKYIALLN